MTENPTSFIRYLRLYTLHSVEQTASNSVYLQARIATLKYVFQHLPKALDTHWQQNTELGIISAQDVLISRFEQLLEDEDGEQSLILNGEAEIWHPYWTMRQARRFVLPAVKSFTPTLSISSSIIPYQQNRWMKRINQAERWLDLTRKTIEVANLGLQLWQQWKIGREQQRLLQDQRMLLKDSVQATLIGQQAALGQASDPKFVQNYLVDHRDDEVYEFLFEDDDE